VYRTWLSAFFSATHYVFLLAAGFATWRMGTRHFGLGRLAAFGLVLLLWTGPSAVLYTSFYRAAKVGLLTAALFTTWAWLNARACNDGARARWCAALFAVLAATMPMFDKRGLIFLVALVLFLVRNAVVASDRSSKLLLMAGVAAFLAAWCYQRFLGPSITRHLHGYEVNRVGPHLSRAGAPDCAGYSLSGIRIMAASPSLWAKVPAEAAAPVARAGAEGARVAV
jgi:hypothetical protein